MANGDLIKGYVITHPHDPYEDVVAIHINQFEGGGSPWQAQIYVEGSLVDSDYFASEPDAMRWAAREVTLIACVAKVDIDGEKHRIANALEDEADLTPCSEDAMVTRSNARLVRADFSYDEAERLEIVEEQVNG